MKKLKTRCIKSSKSPVKKSQLKSAGGLKPDRGQQLLTSFFTSKKLKKENNLEGHISNEVSPARSGIASSLGLVKCEENESDVEIVAEFPSSSKSTDTTVSALHLHISKSVSIPPDSASSVDTADCCAHNELSTVVGCRDVSFVSMKKDGDAGFEPSSVDSTVGLTPLSCHQVKIESEELVIPEQCCEDTGTDDEAAINEALSTSQLSYAPVPYYLQSFNDILHSVVTNSMNDNLLDEQDRSLITLFSNLPSQAQMLYVRLFQRKAKWLRVDSLKYSEIGENLSVAVTALCEAGLVDDQLNDADAALTVLTNGELRQLCHKLHVNAGGNRSTLVNRLVKFGSQHRSVFSAISSSRVVLRQALLLAGSCVKLEPSSRQGFLRVILLYSIPQYEDLEDAGQCLWSLSSVRLGKLVFPRVTVSKETNIFSCREDLLRYEKACNLEIDLRGFIDTKDWESAFRVYLLAQEIFSQWIQLESVRKYDKNLPEFLRKYTALSLLTYIRNQGVDILQRRKDYEGAVKLLRDLLNEHLYLPDYRGRWYDRLTLNLHQHLRRQEESKVELERGLQDSWVRGGHRLALEQRLTKLQSGGAKRNRTDGEPSVENGRTVSESTLPSIEIEARCLKSNTQAGERRVFLLENGDSDDGDSSSMMSCSVEELALSRYRSDGFSEGCHCEERMVKTLFALLFWDILYETSVPDAFHSDLQSAPLDLNSDHFFARRTSVIESRLEEIEAGHFREHITRVWLANESTSSLASWDVFRDVQHALSLARCMGGKLLRAVCFRFAKDHRFHRSGFPDLTVWDEDSGRCKFVEVKGPNDRLSTKQMLWIEYLNGHSPVDDTNGVLAEVCYVRAVGMRRRILRTSICTPANNGGGDCSELETARRPRNSRGRKRGTTDTCSPLSRETCSQSGRCESFPRVSRQVSENDSDADDFDIPVAI